MDNDTGMKNHHFSVPAAWCDYNEHFSDCFYLIPFSAGLDHVLDGVGLGQQYRGDFSTYTVESHIRYLREAKENDQLTVVSTIRDADSKRLFTRHEMLRGAEIIATCEFVCLHVDVRIPKSTPFPDVIFSNIQRLKSKPQENS